MNGPDPIDTAVALLYETALEPEQWGAAMAALGRAFDAPMVAHWRFDFERGTASEFRGHGHDPAVQARYIARYHRLDPGASAVAAAPVGQWCGDEQLFDRRVAAHQEYVVDFARPADIGWVGGGKLAADSDQTGVWFGVQRPFDAEPFGADGARLFERLAPHLQRLARIQDRLRHAALDRLIAHAALDALRAAVFVVDAQRRVLLSNRSAEQLLLKPGALAVRRGQLALASSPHQDRWACAVAAACGPLPRGSALQIPRGPSALPLQGAVVPIPARHELANLAFVPLALLFLTEPDAPHLAPEAYRALFGLTPTEAALVFALVNGRTVGEWALERGVSVSTVRTQLNAVFAKTGADSQPRLIRLAKSLPALG